MNFVQAAPSSTRSFAIVFFDAPVSRTVERIDIPSTKHLTIWVRLTVSRRFILTIMLEQPPIVKVNDRYYLTWRTNVLYLSFVSNASLQFEPAPRHPGRML